MAMLHLEEVGRSCEEVPRLGGTNLLLLFKATVCQCVLNQSRWSDVQHVPGGTVHSQELAPLQQM